ARPCDDPVNHRRVLRDRSTLRAPPKLTYDKDGNQCETQDKAHMAESTTKVPDYDAFTIPANHEEAMASPWAEYWREAEREELKSLMKTNTYEEVDLEPGAKAIDCKWVYTVKWKEGEGKRPIKKFKARLVAKGFQQRKGVDFWDTFAPTVSATSIRTFITVAKVKGMSIHQMDVSTAFLQGDIDCTTYVTPPAPFACEPGKAWRLNSPLYGLKQAPRCWAE